MYYSKNGATQVAVPKNYGGNAFFIEDKFEKNLDYSPQKSIENDAKKDVATHPKCDDSMSTKIDESTAKISPLFADISVEDLLLLGLIFVIYQSDPKDPTLFTLLILLLVK